MSDLETDPSLADLSDTEAILLAELVRLFVRSDGELTETERDQIDRIASRAGESFWKHMERAAESGAEPESILRQAEAITDTSIQELLYGNLYELSIADGSDSAENAILDRLAAAWKLDINEVPAD